MRIVRPCLLALSMLSAALPAAAQAPTVSIQFHNGNVTLQARNAPLRTILQEWARVGRATIVNADRVTGPAMTIELTDVPEGRALATLLRSTAGYMVGARQVLSSGPSSFDRIMILPPSAITAAPPARVVASPLPPLQAPPPAPIAYVPGEPDDNADGANRVLTNAQMQNQLNARAAAARSAALEGQQQQQQPPVAGQPQPPATTPNNPFFSGQSGRPGEIAPVPQQRNPNRPNGDPEP